MSKLTWDTTGTRFYETGVSKGVLYPQNADGTYAAGVAWNGLTAVTDSPDGAEPNDLYADNIKYATLRSAETLGMTIEAYTYPDEWAVCDGSALAASGNSSVAGVYIGQQARQPFGFCYRTEVGNDTYSYDGETAYKLHLIYNCTASPSEKSYETVNDSPDAITFSWEVTTIPVPVTGYKPTASIVIDKSKLDATGKSYLAVLEGYLYGKDAEGQSEATDPYLPTPNEVISIMTSGSIT